MSNQIDFSCLHVLQRYDSPGIQIVQDSIGFAFFFATYDIIKLGMGGVFAPASTMTATSHMSRERRGLQEQDDQVGASSEERDTYITVFGLSFRDLLITVVAGAVSGAAYELGRFPFRYAAHLRDVNSGFVRAYTSRAVRQMPLSSTTFLAYEISMSLLSDVNASDII